MKSIPNKSIDMILCDLPYGYTKNKWDDIIPLDELWKEYTRIIKDNGVIALTAQGMLTAQLMMAGKALFRYKTVWIKGKAANFLNAHRQPLRKHEDILIFYKSQPTYNPQMTQGKPYDKGFRKDQQSSSYGVIKPVRVKSDGLRFPNDILDDDILGIEEPQEDIFSCSSPETEGKVYHPTQKPIALGQYLIKTYSNEHDLILDNTCGSGSFLIAAAKENRRFIGIEKNIDVYHHEQKVDFIDICKRRLNEVNPEFYPEVKK